MRRPFHKMHGLGNDFVIVDARDDAVRGHAGACKAIADRRTGVGCDQLIVLEPATAPTFKMRIWNSDGGEVESCGNATRCVVQLTGAERIDTDGGLLEGQDLGGEVEVTLPEPRFGWDEIPLAYPMDTNALPMAWDEPRTSDGGQRRQSAPRLLRARRPRGAARRPRPADRA